MRYRSGAILAVVGALVALYCGWSWHRVSNLVVMTDPGWPRQFPYPDRWLLALNDWFDARHPAAPGSVKLHGELPRVRRTVIAAAGCAALLFGAGAAPLARLMARRLRHHRGFEIVTKTNQGPPV